MVDYPPLCHLFFSLQILIQKGLLMKFSYQILGILMMLTPVFAQQAPKSGNPNSSIFGSMLPMMILMFVAIWFLMIRPEQKKQKQRQSLMSNLQKGDKVLTSGGMFGTVGNVKDKSVMVKIGENTIVEFTKSSIVSVLNEDGSEKVIDPKAAKPEVKEEKKA
jgi:preprotein translocase subunit YajC